jgi:hypothetical protein
MAKRATLEQIRERATRGAAVRAKLDDPEHPQLTLEDVIDASDPQDVLRAMDQGQLADLGFGAARGRR